MRDKRGCKGIRGEVCAPYQGEYAAGGHWLWVYGNWIWCTKCEGFANRVPRKLTTACTQEIERCGKYALRWLKGGRAPYQPHGEIAPFGTRPVRAWAAEPPGRRDAANDLPAEEVLDRQASEVLFKIMASTQVFETNPSDSDELGEDRNVVAPAWP